MRKGINDAKKQSDERRRKMLAQLSEFTSLHTETDNELDEAIALEHEYIYQTKRGDAVAPPQPEKNVRNPHGIVDILTFCEHPYFLNQRLTPWQKMILKLFYAGTDGNSHLARIDDTRPEDNKSCTGCVWNYVRESEEKHARGIKVFQAMPDKLRMIPEPNMLLENSPCMNCSRYNDEYRNLRYTHKRNMAYRPSEIKELEELANREPIDAFTNEQDLIDDQYVENDAVSNKVREQIKEKIGERFQELILVLGRRGSKSYLVSMIALYETYRFLSMGHPQKYFPIMEFDTITICNVAVSEAQAKAAIFDKIKSLATTSPFFTNHIGKPPTQLSMYFLTEHDKEENARRAEMGMEPLEGTIELMSGHSNAAGLVGRTMAIVIIDEMAEMAGNKDDGGDDSVLYAKLKPSIATFGREGKIICISNPLGQKGKFYDLYNNAFDDRTMLMFQLPTWKANPNIEKSYLASEKLKDPENYSVFYGAQFASNTKDPFLPETTIDDAFERGNGRSRLEEGEPLIQYYAHLDPAESSDNYTLVIVHAEPADRVGPKGEVAMKIVVDHMMIWRPINGHKINAKEVEDYLIQLKKKFNIVQVSFDQWNSQSSIANLLAHGINAIRTTFNKDYNDKIYAELYELFVRELIDIYHIDTVPHYECKECKEQFKWLRRVWQGSKPRIEAAPGFHDDFPDAIASAAFQALSKKVFTGLPRIKTVRIAGFR